MMRWLASAALAVALALAPTAAVRAAEPAAPPSEHSERRDFHMLTITILDGQTEEQLSARCSVVDAGGQPVYPIPAAGCFYHAPYGDAPSHFYSGGQSILLVPSGPTEVTVARGFEYGTVVDTVGVASDTTVTIHIDRWIDMNGLGFYSGDCHTHADHSGGVYTVEPDDALFMAQAEGLNVINCLDIAYFFTGGPDPCSTSDCIVYNDGGAQEQRLRSLGPARTEHTGHAAVDHVVAALDGRRRRGPRAAGRSDHLRPPRHY